MRKILVAIDGSDASLRALDFAVQQARLAPAADLHVLTVQLLASTYTAWEIYVSADKLREIAAAPPSSAASRSRWARAAPGRSACW